jgi:hypothetical protein
VIKPVATAKLTAGTELPGENDDPDTFVGNKTLTLEDKTIAIASGNLLVPGVLKIAVANGITGVGTGSLTLDTGGILSLAQHATDGDTYTVTIGNTVIAGVDGTESRLTAINGPVTLAADRISGNGSTLQVVPDMGSPTITVDPNVAGNKTLTLAGVNLDLVNNGSLIIKGINSAGDGNRVVLAPVLGQNPASLVLGDTFDNSITSLGGRFLECGANDAALSGNGIVRGDSEVLPTAIGDLAATSTSNLVIKGIDSATDDVTISAGNGVRE